jgi:hypothetical protein
VKDVSPENVRYLLRFVNVIPTLYSVSYVSFPSSSYGIPSYITAGNPLSASTSITPYARLRTAPLCPPVFRHCAILNGMLRIHDASLAVTADVLGIGVV